MKKAAYTALVIIMLGAVIFMLGPKAPTPKLDPTPTTCSVGITELDAFIAQREASYKTLKPGNEASITWVDDSVHQTEYAIVYLHGYTASKMEGRPVVPDFAKEFGMNLVEPRLFAHGLDTVDVLIELTPENYIHSAKEAIAMAKVVGRKVIVMCCSTGGTLGLYLAAHDPAIAAVVAYSPNIDLFDPASKVLTGPWGLQLARLITGDDSREYDAPEEFKRYWQTRYRLESVMTVRSVVDATMTPETFSKITQPVFVGCYYKSDAAQDSVVSVAAMRTMMDQLGTPAAQKRMVEFPDAKAHVITNPLRSKDVEGVMEATRKFATEVLGLKPRTIS